MLRRALFALFLLAAFSIGAMAQSPEDVRRIAAFNHSLTGLIQTGQAYSAELIQADTALSDALDGYGDLDQALGTARASLNQSQARLNELRGMAGGIVPPVLEGEEYAEMLEAALSLPDVVVDVYASDIQTLTGRIELALTGSPDLAQGDRLDAAWAASARKQIAAENVMLEASLSFMDKSHPQFGLSKSYLISNQATLPILGLFKGPQHPFSDADFASAVTGLRQGADDIDAAIADARRATGKWRLGAFGNKLIRDLVRLYDASFQTEIEIAKILRHLADAMETGLATETYVPEVFVVLDEQLQAHIQARAEQMQARLVLIGEAMQQRAAPD